MAGKSKKTPYYPNTKLKQGDISFKEALSGAKQAAIDAPLALVKQILNIDAEGGRKTEQQFNEDVEARREQRANYRQTIEDDRIAENIRKRKATANKKKGGKVSISKKPRGVGCATRGYGKALTGRKK